MTCRDGSCIVTYMKALHFLAALLISIPCAVGIGYAAGNWADQCREVTFTEGWNYDRWNADYGTWTDDYGHVVGYALQEDSTIWNEVTCL